MTGSWWERYVVPRLVDASLDRPDVAVLRSVVCAGLAGRVLELGFGSGLNLPHLPATVTRLDAVEPSDLAWRRSHARRERSPVPVNRTGIDGQDLSADDAAYDAVLCTFTLCTVPDPERVLAETMRVLRPGGSLHLLEHGLAPTGRVRAWQHRLDPLEQRIAGGCHLVREPPVLARRTGFVLGDVRQGYLAGPAFSRPWGFVTSAVGWGVDERP